MVQNDVKQSLQSPNIIIKTTHTLFSPFDFTKRWDKLETIVRSVQIIQTIGKHDKNINKETYLIRMLIC